jgi:hypothetical protein
LQNDFVPFQRETSGQQLTEILFCGLQVKDPVAPKALEKVMALAAALLVVRLLVGEKNLINFAKLGEFGKVSVDRGDAQTRDYGLRATEYLLRFQRTTGSTQHLNDGLSLRGVSLHLFFVIVERTVYLCRNHGLRGGGCNHLWGTFVKGFSPEYGKKANRETVVCGMDVDNNALFLLMYVHHTTTARGLPARFVRGFSPTLRAARKRATCAPKARRGRPGPASGQFRHQ